MHSAFHLPTAVNGDRPGVRNIGIVISDGQSTDRDATATEATAMIPEGITMIALGVDVKGTIVFNTNNKQTLS